MAKLSPKTLFASPLLGLALVFAAMPVAAVPVSIVQVGTFTTAPGSGNVNAGMNPGNKFVIRTTYDAAITPAVIRTIDGLDFRVIDLNAGGNSFDLFVPMEGQGQVYSQDETNHLNFFNPTPQILFTATQTSNPGDPNNLPPVADPTLGTVGAPDFVGYEFEGDFANSDPAGPTNGNFAELVVEVANIDIGGGVIQRTANFVTQVAHCSDFSCSDFGIAIRSVDTNPAPPAIVLAQALVAEAGPDIVYDAGGLTQTTDASSLNNNLGNARTDKEDFVSYDWTGPGGALVGTDVDGTEFDIIPGVVGSTPRAVENVNKMVGILDSGLTTTIDVVQWQVEVNEDLTGLGPSFDTVDVSYANALPVINGAAAMPQGDGLLFTLDFTDPDLVVNALIADFELLDVTILVDGLTETAFFASLIAGGSQLVSGTDLVGQFGAGTHLFGVTVADRAGATAFASFQFEVQASEQPVPAPASAALLVAGLAGWLAQRRRRPGPGHASRGGRAARPSNATSTQRR